MDRKKLYDLGKHISERLYSLERKVFLTMDFNKSGLQREKETYLSPRMSAEQIAGLQKRIESAKKKRRKERLGQTLRRTALTAAAVIGLFILLPNTSGGVAGAMENLPFLGKLVSVVTFREYHYADERNTLELEVPELTVGGDFMTASLTDAEEAADGEETEIALAQRLEQTADGINREIREITERLTAEFEENLVQEQGRQSVIVQSEILSETDDFFSLKLICYQEMGSGAEWDYYYTIDLTTGERMTLAGLFKEDFDYIGQISGEIRRQMKEQMDADENVLYWLEDEEVPEWNFRSITAETDFYLDQDGRLVICFDEGEVAPMYMGCVKFQMPEEIYQR